MKTHKSVSAVFSVIALSFLLSGCYPTGEQPLNGGGDIPDATELSQSNEQEYDKEIENLTVSVNLPENTANEAAAVRLTIRKWDTEAITNLFIGGKKIVEHSSQTPGHYFPGEFIEFYTTDDDSMLILESGEIDFHNGELYGNYGYGRFCTGTDHLDFDKLPNSLEGFSKSDAEKMTRDLLNKLDITYVGEPDIYAITNEMGNDFVNTVREAGFDEEMTQWTKDDEIYIFVYPLQYEGLPVATHSVRIKGTSKSSPESFVRVVVSKKGLVALDCRGIYNEEYEKGDVCPINIDAKTALNSLVSSYSKIVLEYPTVINDCRLMYFPTAVDGDVYTCTPFWRIAVLNGTESIGTYRDYEYINAQTGVYASYN